jgi:hypothetical protein
MADGRFEDLFPNLEEVEFLLYEPEPNCSMPLPGTCVYRDLENAILHVIIKSQRHSPIFLESLIPFLTGMWYREIDGAFAYLSRNIIDICIPHNSNNFFAISR